MNTIKHRAENLNNGGSVTVYYCGYEKCEGGHFFKRCTGMTPKEFVADSHKQKSSSNT